MAIDARTFGPFTFDPSTGLLARDQVEVQLGKKATRLLEALLEPAGEVRSKAELMEAAWPDTAVEESNLTVQIAALRKALGKSPDGAEYIVTLPRVGYRLVGDLTPTNASAGSFISSNLVRPTLVILPFAEIGGGSDQSYFADGVVEDIITALSRFKSFAVVARNSSFTYRDRVLNTRQIADELAVRYLLMGSIRRIGEKIRIAVQLTDAASATHIWAETFDGSGADLFKFQDEITSAVASVIEPEINRAEIDRARSKPPEGLTDYDTYLSARALILTESEADNAEALQLLSDVLSRNPENGLVLAHAAWVLEHRLTMGWRSLGSDDRERCLGFAHRGLQFADGDTTVMSHCGLSLLLVGREYDFAFAVLQAAERANPHAITAVVYAAVANLHCGDLQDAIDLFQRAFVLSPRDPLAHISLEGTAHAYIARREYETALQWASRALALNVNFDPTYWVLIAANALLGRHTEAQRYLTALTNKAPGVTIARIKAGQPDKFDDRMAAILEGLAVAGLAAG